MYRRGQVREMAQPGCRPIMTPSYGTHLVLPEYDSARGTGLVWFTEDGRVLYLLPWEGSTVAGTTDRPGDPKQFFCANFDIFVILQE